jgi:serine/threonine-protein kinase
MPLACVAGLVEALSRSPILEAQQRRELAGLAARFPGPRELGRELIRRGWLTDYQVSQVLLGRAGDLLLGPYVLLERLGEGGMGIVYKARHRSLARVVALKVVRKDYLDNPSALPRFHREIQAAAQLDHPNVVHAFDAGQAGGTYFFAMEYIDGTDLSRMIKEQGPLQVLQACDYIRQAALGLQHAFEKGFVHRDVKPANLLVVRPGTQASLRSTAHIRRPFGSAFRWGVLKILDMGLARLHDPDDGSTSTLVTQVGSIMGTPDYIAPEQALDSHTSDIRADIYSLGCTLYFLLAGQVPFPNGSLTEKLMQHQREEPEPLSHVRRERLLKSTPAGGNPDGARGGVEVPQPICALVRRLMAKQPEDRYQTPGEVAEALAELLTRQDARRAARAKAKAAEETPPKGAAARRAAPPARTVRVRRPDSRAVAAQAPRERKAAPTQRLQRPEVPLRPVAGPRTRRLLVVCGFLLLLALSAQVLGRSRTESRPPPPLNEADPGAPGTQRQAPASQPLRPERPARRTVGTVRSPATNFRPAAAPKRK